MSIIKITSENFDAEVLRSDKPVLIDFWAEWCYYCSVIAPIVDEIAAEQETAIKVGKINIDEAVSLAQRFNVEVIPTLLAFKDGDLIGKKVGAVSKEEILSLFK